MSWFDWLILVLPVCLVMGMGFYTRRYVRGVADFLSAGRLCGRYVICVGDVANALSIIGLLTYVEIHYKTGFALAFWSGALAPLWIAMSLMGYCHYRFRETRAMSLGQFLEMRYSRRFRIFASGLRSIAEMIANMIMPALAARFFIQFLGLPPAFSAFGVQVSTYVALMVVFLALAVTLVCCGGTLALVVTDTVQGMIMYPILLCFIVFLLRTFSVGGEIVPVMADRVAGESFLDPFDISGLRDFNFFTMVVVVAYTGVMNRAIWIGAGYSTAAKSPHEAKMAGILGTWRGASSTLFYILVACGLVTFLNHPHFAQRAHEVRRELAVRAAGDVLADAPAARKAVETAVAEIPVLVHRIGVDPPLSQAENPDAVFLSHVHDALLAEARERTAGESGPAVIDAEGLANDRFQQCRTLFHQQSLPAAVRALLPPGLFGLFALLLFLAMVSTDDSRIYSAALTIAQDVVLPLHGRPFTPRGHIAMIRVVTVCIGAFFLAGSYFMKQLDYIHMFNQLAVSMWTSGAGPVMVFGLYSRFGTAAGAWAALGTSSAMSVLYMLVQRNWADVVYPAIAKAGLVASVDRALRALSAPFGSWIDWKMDAVKCPVNTIEFMFFLMLLTLALYVIVSKLTCRAPFDLDRMLHRAPASGAAAPLPLAAGRSGCSGAVLPQGGAARGAAPLAVLLRSRCAAIAAKLAGITPEYSRGDRAIAWGVFFYSYVFSFGICFLAVAVWNAFSRWPVAWWGRYFVFVNFVVPGVVGLVSTFWFGIGGMVGLRRLFRDLDARTEIDDSDDGRVEDRVPLQNTSKP